MLTLAVSPALTFVVHGLPVPQGSMRHKGNGRIRPDNEAELYAWRADVQRAAEKAIAQDELFDGPLTGAVALRCVFRFPRPASHFGSGRNAGVVRPALSKDHHGQRPDVDKLARSVMDACTYAGVWRDDGQVAHLMAAKVWGLPAGLSVVVTAL